MQDVLNDLLEEAQALRDLADARGGEDAAVAASMLGSAIDAGDAAALQSAIDAFHELPLEDRRAMLNGWAPANSPARPRRDELMAVQQLAGIRRILAVDVTAAAFIPSHEWALRDSSPVRVEIHAGTPLAEVKRALDRLLRMLPLHWEMLIDEDGAASVAKEYQRVDLRTGTIDGIPVADWTPGPGKVAEMEDGSNGL